MTNENDLTINLRIGHVWDDILALGIEANHGHGPCMGQGRYDVEHAISVAIDAVTDTIRDEWPHLDERIYGKGVYTWQAENQVRVGSLRTYLREHMTRAHITIPSLVAYLEPGFSGSPVAKRGLVVVTVVEDEEYGELVGKRALNTFTGEEVTRIDPEVI